jgi:hypothetical protein
MTVQSIPLRVSALTGQLPPSRSTCRKCTTLWDLWSKLSALKQTWRQSPIHGDLHGENVRFRSGGRSIRRHREGHRLLRFFETRNHCLRSKQPPFLRTRWLPQALPAAGPRARKQPIVAGDLQREPTATARLLLRRRNGPEKGECDPAQSTCRSRGASSYTITYVRRFRLAGLHSETTKRQ